MLVKMLRWSAVVGLLVSSLSLSARADTITLTLSPVSGLPGTTVTVDGTIANTGSDTVYLNSENFTLNSPSFLNGDITDFLLNAPLSLAGGTDSGLIPIFSFDIDPATLAGPYAGNFIDIIGGTDPSDFTDTLASAEFAINVQGAVNTPEPSTFVLLGASLILFAIRKRFARVP